MDSLQFNRTAKALRNQFASPPITIFTREQVKEIIAIDRLGEKSGIKNRTQHISRAFAVSAQQISDILERNGNYGHQYFDDVYPTDTDHQTRQSSQLQ